MKKIMLALLVFSSAAVAQGSPDTLLGPVVAIQRHITDAESACLNHIIGEIDQRAYAFTCRLEFPLDLAKETVINPIQSFSQQDSCSVEMNYLRGGIVIFFGNPNAPATFEEAKICLNKGLAKTQNKIDILIFKISENALTVLK